MTDLGPVVRPSAARRERLTALANWHDQWVDEHLPAAVFDRERARAKDPSDYNEHYLDVNPSAEAEDAFHARARAIMGITPPST